MTDAERWTLNRAVAERVMGWKALIGDAIPESITSRYCHDPHLARVWVDGNGKQMACWESNDMPDFAGDIAAAYAMEEAIPEGKRHAYVEALTVIVEGAQRLNAWQTGWALLHATPEQRCRAAVRVMEGK